MLLTPIRARGIRTYELAYEHDLEGMVAKWARGTYPSDRRGTLQWMLSEVVGDQWLHITHDTSLVEPFFVVGRVRDPSKPLEKVA